MVDVSLADWDSAPLLTAAIDAAAECEHVDVRLVSTRTVAQSRRDHVAKADVDHSEVALGVRVVRDGCWGFAATDRLTPIDAAQTAKTAVALAHASAATATAPVELAPEPQHQGTWRSGFDIDPFSIPSEQRMQFLEWGSSQLLKHPAVHHTDASLMAVAETVAYADSHGTSTRQHRIRLQADFTAVHLDPNGQFTTLTTTAPPVARGWEFLGDGNGVWPWHQELSELPDLLSEKAAAPTVEPGRRTLVIDPTNLWLTIHESVAHATELDRILGYEANYAGTSFVAPTDIGQLQYGSSLMNVQADRTVDHGLSTVAWDDEGVAAQEWPLITNGVLVGVQLDRAMAAANGLPRSNGCAYADSGSHTPLQRMPNISLMPDPAGGDVEKLIAGVDDGIYVVGDNSWSIDMQRYNFQFTGQQFHRIKSGRLAGQLRDVAYQGRTPDFWRSMVAVGGPQSFLLAGALNCGKGQPGQSAPVSHGTPAAVFENVNILNSREEAGS
ncbi:MAG: peptidase C69 [Micrococcales bacterium]|nr:peptidase C69 [Micrococcales bacterium]